MAKKFGYAHRVQYDTSFLHFDKKNVEQRYKNIADFSKNISKNNSRYERDYKKRIKLQEEEEEAIRISEQRELIANDFYNDHVIIDKLGLFVRVNYKDFEIQNRKHREIMPQYLVRPDSSYTLSGIPRFTITQLFNIAKLYGVPEKAVQNTSSLYETKKQAHEHFKNR